MPKISKIWKYFEKEKGSDPKCKICLKSVKSTNNTSNLMAHLKTKHGILYDQLYNIEDSSQNKIDNLLEEVNSTKNGSLSNNITMKIIWWLIWNGHPYRICEQRGFKEMLHSLNRNYSPPGRNKIQQMIGDLYETKKMQLHHLLSTVKGYSITSDGWTDVSNQVSFLGITIHFIDNYKLYSVCVKADQIDTSNADNISKMITDVIDEIGVSKDILMAITTDGASNYTKAARSIGSHIHCIAHQLNLIVEDGLENSIVLSQIVHRVREIVTAFKRSSVLMTHLMNLQSERDEVPLKVIQDVPTRWNSTFHMIQRYLQLHKEISILLIEHGKRDIDLSDDDIKVISEISKILQPFDEMTTDISGEKYITISRIIPLFNIIKNIITKISLSEHVAKSLVIRLLNGIDKRFGPIERDTLFAFATLLDPRFKKIDFSSGVDCENAVKKLNSLLGEVDLTQRPPEPETDHGIWALHNKRAKSGTNPKPGINSGLQHYLESEVIPLQSDPLLFWQNNKMNWPELHNLALQYLCIQPTSVACERLFSTTGAIISQKRNRIKPKNVGILSFLESLPDPFI